VPGPGDSQDHRNKIVDMGHGWLMSMELVIIFAAIVDIYNKGIK